MTQQRNLFGDVNDFTSHLHEPTKKKVNNETGSDIENCLNQPDRNELQLPIREPFKEENSDGAIISNISRVNGMSLNVTMNTGSFTYFQK